MLQTAPSAKCVEAVKTIINHFGAQNVFVLSKCGQAMQQATVCMLGKNDFFKKTGLIPQNVLFCTNRGGGSPPENMKEL